jgi:hypothetical protein
MEFHGAQPTRLWENSVFIFCGAMVSREMWHRLWRVLAVIFLALMPLISVGATPTPAPSPLPSGIEGVILVSPSRPGPIRKDEASAAPAGNLAFVVMKEGAKVISFTTDPAGAFRVSLAPGHYIVERDPATKIGHWRFEVDVKPGEITTVRWVGDSGMR